MGMTPEAAAVMSIKSKQALGRMDLNTEEFIELGIAVGRAIERGDNFYDVIDRHQVISSPRIRD